MTVCETTKLRKLVMDQWGLLFVFHSSVTSHSHSHSQWGMWAEVILSLWPNHNALNYVFTHACIQALVLVMLHSTVWTPSEPALRYQDAHWFMLVMSSVSLTPHVLYMCMSVIRRNVLVLYIYLWYVCTIMYDCRWCTKHVQMYDTLHSTYYFHVWLEWFNMTVVMFAVQLLAEVMCRNSTIVYLNLESNRLTLPGIKVFHHYIDMIHLCFHCVLVPQDSCYRCVRCDSQSSYCRHWWRL